MDMEKFIELIDVYNYGIVAFNTYRLSGVNRCYIMVGERGSVGRFLKFECDTNKLNSLLDAIIDKFRVEESD